MTDDRKEGFCRSVGIVAGLAVILGAVCGGWLWYLSKAKPRNQMARWGPDNPHGFTPTAGFRTCSICGLPRNDKIHDAEDSANR